jgi:hypothetical protein
MIQTCLEHFGWEQRDECSHCSKLNSDLLIEISQRLNKLSLEHTKQCYDNLGRCSEPNDCCPCTCYVSVVQDILNKLNKNE